MAWSSVVVAACAVAVTIKVLSTDIASARPLRVLDQQSLERQVAEKVQGLRKDALGSVECPTSVVVEVGRQFDCRVWGKTNPETVYVKIIDDQGELSISTSPR
ncbi:hypothetical protein ALI144C_23530 [Actinosynnema sp. ALI-1.44]|nr:hypothetical protein ALI144C_23530 [Actinosynnema sp. ALI-1.44]